MAMAAVPALQQRRGVRGSRRSHTILAGSAAATLYAGQTFIGVGRDTGTAVQQHLRGAVAAAAGPAAAAPEPRSLPAALAGAAVAASAAAAATRAARRSRRASGIPSRDSVAFSLTARRAETSRLKRERCDGHGWNKNDPEFDSTSLGPGTATMELKKRPSGVLRYGHGTDGKGAIVLEMQEKSRYPGDPKGQAAVGGVKKNYAIKSIGGQQCLDWDFVDIMDLLDDYEFQPTDTKEAKEAWKVRARKYPAAELPVQVEFQELIPQEVGEVKMEIPDDGKWRPRMGGWTDEELAAERAKYNAMAPAAGYAGPTYAGPSSITDEWIKTLLKMQEDGKTLPLKDLALMILDVVDLLKKEKTIQEVTIKEGQELKVVGDLHGQYWDFMHLLGMTGMPSPTNPIHFNGDFVDRGSWSIEVISILFAFKLQHPEFAFFNRGNHELMEANIIYGFMGECHAKFGTGEIFDLFSESFRWLPLAHVFNKDIMVVHGGLPGPDPRLYIPGQSHDPSDAIPPNSAYPTIEMLQKIDRYTELSTPSYKAAVGESEDLYEIERRHIIDMLWSDPRGTTGYGPSFRKSNGIFMFGPDVSDAFCARNGLSLVIRSHEVKMEGFKYDHPKLLTIFSAANYLDTGGNKGAYAKCVPKADGKLKLDIIDFEAQPHPDTPPMFWQDYVSENLSYLTKKMKKKTGPVRDSNGMIVEMSKAQMEEAANQWEEDTEDVLA